MPEIWALSWKSGFHTSCSFWTFYFSCEQIYFRTLFVFDLKMNVRTKTKKIQFRFFKRNSVARFWKTFFRSEHIISPYRVSIFPSRRVMTVLWILEVFPDSLNIGKNVEQFSRRNNLSSLGHKRLFTVNVEVSLKLDSTLVHWLL